MSASPEPPSAEGRRLAGKTAVVSGGARGIGRAIVESFVAAGATVVVLDVLAEEGEALCSALGPSASFRLLDVTSEEAWTRLAASLEGTPPDVLVNNAGGQLTAALLHEHTAEAWQRTLELNLTSVFYAMRSLIPLMIGRGSGSIINIGSISGLVGQADAPAYQAAKAGVAMLTRNAAIAYGPHGIRVNAISPSVITTPALGKEADERTASFVARIPLGRAGEPGEVGRAAVFLASDEASYVTGADLAVDGGYLA